MMEDLAKLERALLDWIIEWNEGEPIGELTADTDIFAVAALDSMGFTGLIAYLEDETNIEFDFDNADASAGVSVRSLLDYCFPAGHPHGL